MGLAMFLARTCACFYRHSKQLKNLLVEDEDFSEEKHFFPVASPFSLLSSPSAPSFSASPYSTLQQPVWKLEVAAELFWANSVIPKLVETFKAGLHDMGMLFALALLTTLGWTDPKLRRTWMTIQLPQPENATEFTQEYIPCRCSEYIFGFLMAACREIQRAYGHTLNKVLIS